MHAHVRVTGFPQLQYHFHIKHDYLNRDLLIRGNHYQSN